LENLKLLLIYATKDAGGGFKSSDIRDPDLRIVGAMSVFLPETLPSFHLEGDHLVTLYMIQDLSLDHSLHILPGSELVAIGQKNFSKLDLVTGIARDAGNVQSLILLDLELLTGYFHNC